MLWTLIKAFSVDVKAFSMNDKVFSVEAKVFSMDVNCSVVFGFTSILVCNKMGNKISLCESVSDTLCVFID